MIVLSRWSHNSKAQGIETSLALVLLLFGALTSLGTFALFSEETGENLITGQQFGSPTGPGSVTTTDNISQNGITWTFDKAYEFGRYANGDYWVKIDDTTKIVTITGITPRFTGTFHGWEVNPSRIIDQSFDSRVGHWNSNGLPTPTNPDSTNPYKAKAGESLVKAVSYLNCNHNPSKCPGGIPRPSLKTVSVLTIVDAVPANNGLTVFRPPYFGKDKTTHSTTSLRLDLLPRYKPTANAQTPLWVEQRFAKTWLDHKHHERGRYIHPGDHMPDYGANIGLTTAEAALTLMLDYTPQQKTQAAINYVQYGIDLYAAFKGGLTTTGGFSGIGGHGPGRKLPMVMAAYLLQDQTMMNYIQNAPKSAYQENDDATFSQQANNGKGQVLWGQTGAPEEFYWGNLQSYNFNGRTTRDPYGLIDGGFTPGGAYQFCCTSASHKGYVLALHLLPALKPIANSPELITYMDRWVNFGAWSQPDKCAPPDPRDRGKNHKPGSNRWQYYGITYGPDGKGGCILDTDSSDGIGRFPNSHGTNKDGGGHRSTFVDNMWNTYRGASRNVFYVSPTGSGSRDGSSPTNAFSLNNALTHSRANTNKEVTYFLASGAYGTFTDTTSRSEWHTWKADTGQQPVFSFIDLRNSRSPRKEMYLRFEGIEVYPQGVALSWARHLDFNAMKIHGQVSSPYVHSNLNNCARYTSGGRIWDMIGVDNIIVQNSELYNSKDQVIDFRGSNSILRGNKIHSIGIDAVHIWSDRADALNKNNFVIENNEIYNVGDCFSDPANPHPDGISVFLGPGTPYSLSDIVIKGNTLYNMHAQGIFVATTNNMAHNVLIDHNTLYNIRLQDILVSYVNGLTITHNTIIGGTIHVGNLSVSNARQKDNLVQGLIYYDRPNPGIVEWDYYIANGWQNPAWHATGTHYCKGKVQFIDEKNHDYRLPTTQTGSFSNCGSGFTNPPNLCTGSSTGSYVGAHDCKTILRTCSSQGGSLCSAGTVCSGSTLPHSGSGICCASGGTCIRPKLDDGLVSHWKLDEASSATTFSDETGQNPGSCSGSSCPSATTGKINGGFSFDGSDDHIDLGSFDVAGNAMTLAAWFKADDFGVSDARILSKAKGTSGTDIYWMVTTWGNTNGLRFALQAGGNTDFFIANNIGVAANTWTHVAATYDGTYMILYKDGVEVARKAKTGSIAIDSAVKVWLGDNPVGSRHFDGVLDDVRIYNRSLSGQEIKAVMNGSSGTGNRSNKVCTPNSQRSCSTGLQGVCAAGTQTCNVQGTSWGSCNQNVQASQEVCDGKDNDCDGQVDEGSVCGGSLYNKWSNGPSPSSNYFPINVWLQNPVNAQKYKDIGINSFVGLFGGPTQAQIRELDKHIMPAIAHQNALALAHPHNGTFIGWAQQDEPDNAQWNGRTYDPCIDPSVIQNAYNQMKTNDPTRPVYLNFGRGVSHENWGGRGTCTGNLSMYPEYIKGADIISFDIYPVTSEPPVKGKLEYVARGVERLVNWSKGEKVVWNFIETTHISSNTRPSPENVRSEVWMSIIHGSMGISYFVHEWVPSFREDGIFRYPEIVAMVNKTNRLITQLAPVLNSPTIQNAVSVVSSNSAVPIKTMAKVQGTDGYLFAIAMRNESTVATFTVSGIPSSATAFVLEENRQIPITNGVFQDRFEGYEVHLYRIDTTLQRCTPNSKRSCNTGLQGVCATGTQTCNTQGSAWGFCNQTIPASVEICDGKDNDCDGEVDEGGVCKRNSPPTLHVIGNKKISAGQLLRFRVTASDPDNDTLLYSIRNAPLGSSFVNQIFSWRPREKQVGTYKDIQFIVSDKIAQDFENITIEVTPIGDKDGDRVPDSLDCNDNNKNIGECQGCAICSDPKGINGSCIAGQNVCKPLRCPTSICSFGTCGENQTAVFAKTENTSCQLVSPNRGMCKPHHPLQCTSYTCKNEPLCGIDSDGDGVPDATDKCPNTPVGVTVSKLNGCGVRQSKFDNNLSTNLSAQIDLLAVEDLKLGIPHKGVVFFKGHKIPLLEFRSALRHFVPINLNKIVIEHNKIEINTGLRNFSNFSKSAQLTLFNLSLTSPVIHRDNAICTQCSIIDYAEGTLIFTVPSFSTYTAQDPFCGDNVCNGGETCSACKKDCGSCPPQTRSGSGGGGGGGGFTASCTSGQTQSCTTGKQGVCSSGTQKCESGRWESCIQKTQLTPEICDGKDNNCNGVVDDGSVCAACKPGETKACGSAIGICTVGTQKCESGKWGSCENSVSPKPKEICNNNLDDNCNGEIDETCQTPNHCSNAIQDENEMGVDCGGSCPACFIEVDYASTILYALLVVIGALFIAGYLFVRK